MGRSYDAIPVDLQEWALEQQVFFVASAPLTGRHVNLSPKGLPSTTLTIFDPNHVGYVDATGSGVETISHVYENGRATIMFCSFGKGPKIMRWFCKGKVIEWNDPDFGKWVGRMGKKGIVGARAIIVLNVWKGMFISVSYSCVDVGDIFFLIAFHSSNVLRLWRPYPILYS